jgi:uncharacterized protein (TIGR03437 family)
MRRLTLFSPSTRPALPLCTPQLAVCPLTPLINRTAIMTRLVSETPGETPQRTLLCGRLRKLGPHEPGMKIFQLVTGLLVAASALTAQQYTISTYAGIPQIRGWFGDGYPATTIPLDFPLSVATDNKGTLYIDDFQSWIIRMVAPTGIMTTIAGTGTPGYAGDNDLAVNAQLLDVHSLAADGSGNVYLADTATSRIRKIDTKGGNITTFAGNGTRGWSGDGAAATSAELNLPVGIALDSAGNLYIADYGNYTVRKVSASGATITTIAGTGAFGSSGDGGPANKAALGFPYGIAVDAAGNVYFSDTANQNVRKITTDGNIHTVATGVTAQSLAIDSAGNLYYANYLDSTVRRILPNGTQVVIAGNGTSGYSGDGGPATFAQLNGPYGVAIDPSGNIYVADAGNDLVRLLTPAALTVTGVANAASNASAAATGSYVSPGEILTIYGIGLGPAQLTPNQPDANGNYGFQVGGTAVTIGPPGGPNYPAPLLYTSATQVGAIVPYEVGLGTADEVIVSYNGQPTPQAGVTVAPAAPGIFTSNSSGTGQAAAVNQNGTLNSTSAPAPLGSIISLYLTGEGRTSPQGVDGQGNTAANLPTPLLGVTVSIGGQDSVVTYAGGQPGSVAGLMQLNVEIPASLAQTLNFSVGPVAVPVVVDVGGFFSQTGVTIAVSQN